MTGKYMVEIGRVVLINKGRDTGKICLIVDVIDQNRVLVDGPSSGVRRRAIPFKSLSLTKFVVKVPHGTSTGVVKKLWDEAEINKKFPETPKYRQLQNARKRLAMTDFDRFKLYKTKQRVNKAVAAVFRKLQVAARKSRPKPKVVERKPRTALNAKKKAKRLAKKQKPIKKAA